MRSLACSALLCVALGLGLTSAGGARADELVSIAGLGSSARIVRVVPSAGVLKSEVGESLVVTTALPTHDGTDLILVGYSLGTGGLADPEIPSYVRLGRAASAVDSTGEFVVVSSPGMRTLVDGVKSQIVSAAWVGPRHLAVVTGAAELRIFDTAADASGLLKASSYGMIPERVALKRGSDYFAVRVAASLDGEQIFVSDGSAYVLRLDRGKSVVETCEIDGGAASSNVLSLAGLAGGRAVASLQSGRLAILEKTCGTAAASMATAATAPPMTALSRWDDGAGQERIFGGGARKGDSLTSLASWKLSGAVLSDELREGKGMMEPGGAVAAALIGGDTYVLVGGRQVTPRGYHLYKFDGASFAPAADRVPDETPSVFRIGKPAFGLSRRTLDLQTGGASLSYVEIFGGKGARLKVFPGTCKRTTVADGKDEGTGLRQGTPCTMDGECQTGKCNQMTKTCRFPYDPGSPDPVTYTVPTGRALLAFLQPGLEEDCQLVIACDETDATCGAGPQRGGGAIVRVVGARKAMSLVLDQSGSMSLAIDGSWQTQAAPPAPFEKQERYTALKNALEIFYDAINGLPAAAKMKLLVSVVPFDDQSKAKVLPPSGFYTADQLLMQGTKDTIAQKLTPAGSTNIRGALKTAADRLTSIDVADRTVVLMTDGWHNVVGPDGDENTTDAGKLKGVQTSDLLGAVDYLRATDWVTDPMKLKLPRVGRLYAVGLSKMSVQEALPELVRRTNSLENSGSLPPMYIDYADARGNSGAGNKLAQFFLKVLEDNIFLHSFVDPIEVIDDNKPFARQVELSSERELWVVAGWQDPGRKAQIVLKYIDQGDMKEKTVSCPAAGRLAAVCYADRQALNAGTSFALEVRKDGMSPAGPLEVVVEAAARTRVHMVPSMGKLMYRSGEQMEFRVDLSDQGLPITAAAQVVGTLWAPSGSQGSALAAAKISPDEIQKRMQMNLDGSAVAAKFALMRPEDVPGFTRQEGVRFYDDGQHGDRLAGDGVYGAQVTADVPGPYTMLVSAGFDTRFSGKGLRREVTLSTQVVTSLEGATVKQIESYTPPAEGKPGVLVLQLVPQDKKGNLLGPGNDSSLVFRQGARRLPAQITEPAELDGSYRAEVREIQQEAEAVVLAGPGGRVELVKAPMDPIVPTDPGCGCRLTGGPLQAAPAVALLLIAFVALGRRRRQAGRCE